jgi:dihydroorotate dehydrogenase
MDWRGALYRLVRPILFRFDSERIHRLTIDALRISGANPAGRGLAALLGGVRGGSPVQVAGIDLRNRVGIGAGFDKDGVALRGWAALGLGFAEVGTITPIAQPGNPRPRLYRLPADESLVNRMGFNNAGALAVARNVMLARHHLPAGFAVGVNLGCNRETPSDRVVDDYLAAHRFAAPVADYLAINVSSPNTPGLRDLQQPERLRELLVALREAGERSGTRRPLFVKLAPDLDPDALRALIGELAEQGVAGVILSNTTTAREGLRSPRPLAGEPGGLSGAPLLPKTIAAVRAARAVAGDRLAIMASGGIRTGEDAGILREAGADLLQLWTGLVYRGPGLIGDAVAAG